MMEILYTIHGIVKKGAQTGRKLGYPTANVSLQSHIPEGVYAAEVTLEGTTYGAATFIGSAPTYGDGEYKSESHILDFDEDIYGEDVKIMLYKKIRNNENFSSEQNLIAQMKKDVLATRSFFNMNS